MIVFKDIEFIIVLLVFYYFNLFKYMVPSDTFIPQKLIVLFCKYRKKLKIIS